MAAKLGKFARTLRARGPRKENNARSATGAKLEIRNMVLDHIGPAAAVIFDAFAGEGVMYRGAWSRAARYVGCDTTWYPDERPLYVCKSERVLRAVDLAEITIFDADAYGSPWQHLTIIAARRRVAAGERIGIVFTEGSALKVKMGCLPFPLALMAGMNPYAKGTARHFDQIIDRAIREMARRMNCTVLHRWQAEGKKGSAMRYIGLVLEGIAAAETS